MRIGARPSAPQLREPKTILLSKVNQNAGLLNIPSKSAFLVRISNPRWIEGTLRL